MASKKTAKTVTMTDAQRSALGTLTLVGVDNSVNKKTGTALEARGWAISTKKGYKITAAGKRALQSAAA